MKSHDPRVHLDPIVDAHNNKQRIESERIFAEVSPAQLLGWCRDLAQRWLDGTLRDTVETLPADVPSEFQQTIRDAAKGLLGDERSYGSDPVLEGVGRYLASDLATHPERWSSVLESDLPWSTRDSFVEAIPVDAVRLNAEKLPAPKDLSEGVERPFGRVLDVAPDTEASDSWATAASLEHAGGTLMPAVHVMLTAELLCSEPRLLAAWFRSFGHSIALSIIIREITNVTVLLECVECLELPADDLLAVMLVRQIVETLGRITASVVHAGTISRPGLTEVDTEMLIRTRDEWLARDLPTLTSRLTSILTESSRRQLGLGLLRAGLLEPMNPNIAEQRRTLCRSIRQQLVTALGSESFLKDLLTDDVSAGALLAASLSLPVEEESGIQSDGPEVVWEAYQRWLRRSPFYLGDTSEQVAEAVSIALARVTDATRVYQSLWGEFRDRTTGWKWSFDEMSINVYRRVHLSMVGAIASHRLYATGSKDVGRAFFECHWRLVHSWSRQVLGHAALSETERALVHTWARLPKIFEDEAVEAVSASEVARFDRLDWVLACLESLKNNMPDGGLPQSTLRAGRARIDLLSVTWREDRRVRSMTSARLKARVASLDSSF